MKRDLDTATVAIVGLGYVGLPLARAFSKSPAKLEVIGFDNDLARIDRLNRAGARGQDGLRFTTDPGEIGKADFIIICVPTPVTRSKEPDLRFVSGAAEVVGQNMKKGAVVILESTVYPGVTEEILAPVLAKNSGLECGKDFKVAYSPERINPGDEEHALQGTAKVVAGMDEDTTGVVAALYSQVTPAVFRARDIKTAEAAKVIENIQRDLNIALTNELAIIFSRMGLSTRDVLDAAATKWNFHRYSPGLVGGHCIPVDPYYLVYRARRLDYHPQVILAGRAINDDMPRYIAEMTMKALNEAGKVIKGSRVLIMGLAYKENVADIRESPVRGIIKGLKEYGVKITGFDPVLNGAELKDEFGIKLLEDWAEVRKSKVDGVILTVAHAVFRKLSLDDLKNIQNPSPVLIDVRGIFTAADAERAGFYYKTL